MRYNEAMRIFQRISLFLLMIMILILPFWLTFGRSLLGSDGLLTLLYIFFIAPVIFITILVFNVLIWARRDVRQELRLGKIDSFLLLLFYIFVFLHGFFVVDGSDSPESLNSVMTVFFGNHPAELSSFLGGVTYAISCLLIAICFVTFIYELVAERVRKHSNL